MVGGHQEGKNFFYPLSFGDWGMLIKLTKRWVNRRKGVQSLFDVTILMFMCMEGLLVRNEDLERVAGFKGLSTHFNKG